MRIALFCVATALLSSLEAVAQERLWSYEITPVVIDPALVPSSRVPGLGRIPDDGTFVFVANDPALPPPSSGGNRILSWTPSRGVVDLSPAVSAFAASRGVTAEAFSMADISSNGIVCGSVYGQRASGPWTVWFLLDVSNGAVREVTSPSISIAAGTVNSAGRVAYRRGTTIPAPVGVWENGVSTILPIYGDVVGALWSIDDSDRIWGLSQPARPFGPTSIGYYQGASFTPVPVPMSPTNAIAVGHSGRSVCINSQLIRDGVLGVALPNSQQVVPADDGSHYLGSGREVVQRFDGSSFAFSGMMNTTASYLWSVTATGRPSRNRFVLQSDEGTMVFGPAYFTVGGAPADYIVARRSPRPALHVGLMGSTRAPDDFRVSQVSRLTVGFSIRGGIAGQLAGLFLVVPGQPLLTQIGFGVLDASGSLSIPMGMVSVTGDFDLRAYALDPVYGVLSSPETRVRLF